MENNRLIIATIVSGLILFSWQLIFPQHNASKSLEISHNSSDKGAETASSDVPQPIKGRDRLAEKAIALPRVTMKNSKIEGSINLVGPKIDVLSLKDYRKELDSDEKVQLLSHEEGKRYIVALGIANTNNSPDLPTADSVWTSDSNELTPEREVNLSWENKKGLRFVINLKLDDAYMISSSCKVINKGTTSTEVSSYLSLSRDRIAEGSKKSMAVHEGMVLASNGSVKEKSFDNLVKKEKSLKYGYGAVDWVGFSDKYWLTSVVPEKSSSARVMVSAYKEGVSDEDAFQIDVVGKAVAVRGQEEITLLKSDIFAGAKVLSILDKYKEDKKIPLFDKSLDFGIFYFITRPLFVLLNILHGMSGNFGVALMLLTIIVKISLFPLAYKGILSMRKLKNMGPKVAEIKERYKNNPKLIQQKTMEAYKEGGVNPLSGCLPIILQMPVFFAIYKVLSVTIEMRHAPFFGWLKDLSAPDSATVFNLFGLIDWDPPKMLMIGVMPILMSLTMFFQQRLGPKPADDSQAAVMNALPFVFLVMFSSFPSGLLLYWTWSNSLSIIQQTIIDRMHR